MVIAWRLNIIENDHHIHLTLYLYGITMVQVQKTRFSDTFIW